MNFHRDFCFAYEKIRLFNVKQYINRLNKNDLKVMIQN